MVMKGINPYEMAQAQFDKVAAILELDAATRELLRQPLREYSFAIPVRMDDGRVSGLPRLPRPAQRRPRAVARAASASTRRRPSTPCAPSRCG